MTNEQLIQTVKEAMRNDTVLQRGIVDLLCESLEASEAKVKQLAAANQQLRDENLKSTSALYDVVAENAALKDINAWCRTDAFSNMYREFKTAEAVGCVDVDCMHDAMLTAIMHAPATPITDSILSSLRAEGVDMAFEAAKPLIASEFQYSDFDACVSATYKFPESDLVGKVEMVEWLESFAEHIRSQSEQVKGVQS